MTRDDLRSRTGMVLQDTWLFAGSIRDNIAYGRPHITGGEVEAASRGFGFKRVLPLRQQRLRREQTGI